MYTQDDLTNLNRLLKKRWCLVIIPAALLLAAAVTIFVIGQLGRSQQLWKVTTALTLVGGAYFLFFYGVCIRPALIYRKHLRYMLSGRKRTTTGVFKSFSEDVSDRDGLECHAMMVNIGQKDDPEDDRLFYYDVYKERPAIPLGTRIIVESNDKMVSAIQIA